MTVTVKDRGPYVDGRVLDLSPASFRQVASLGAGHFNGAVYRCDGGRDMAQVSDDNT